MIHTESLQEAKYLLERAIRTRGLEVKWNDGSFEVEGPNIKFSLTFMRGNRRVLISHSVKVDVEARGQGIGRRFLNEREAIAAEAGINLLLATVRNENLPEVHLLETSGWKKLLDRVETGCALWGKEI